MDLIYSDFKPDENAGKPGFDKFFDLFKQLLNIAAGDAAQALQWLTELDRRYSMSEGQYSVAEFIEDLKERGFLKEDGENNQLIITPKTERTLRQNALEELFGKLRKSNPGQHKTTAIGKGHEPEPELRAWNAGEDLHHLDVPSTLMNAYRRAGESLSLEEEDLMVHETDHYSATSTVLCIDLSHSMILYGEDRITPARKVALGLAELIMTKYPKDELQIVAFGDDAWQVEVKDLPYLQVGPFHTNTLAALHLSRELLRKSRSKNKQILMITDGKPSCMKEGAKLYKNSFGLDRKIINSVLSEAAQCRKDKIPITTFMIATDPYLQQFVDDLTKTNNGRAYFASLDDLGGFVLQDYVKNRRTKL